ncbi:hypothetical protein STRIP9103_03262, partial [Streptomyces ipomoeae 91-03]
MPAPWYRLCRERVITPPFL